MSDLVRLSSKGTANNSATDTSSLVPETDLEIAKSDSPDPVTAGEDLTYTITVTNNGPSDSTVKRRTPGSCLMAGAVDPGSPKPGIVC